MVCWDGSRKKIGTLIGLLREHDVELEGELLLHGLNMYELSVDQVYAAVSVLLLRENSVLRQLITKEPVISLESSLLARISHVLELANWQRGGGKGSRPKPIRLGAPPKSRVGGTDRSPEEVLAYLLRFAPPED